LSVTLITTFRGSDEQRIRNLDFMLRWYTQMSDWEFLVVEQDESPKFDADSWSPQVRHVLAPNPGPFNRGWGFNVGARLAQNDLLYLTDGDLLVAHSALETGTSLMQRQALAVNPYDHWVDLEPNETQELMESQRNPDFTDQRAAKVRGKGEQLSFCTGAFFMHRGLYRKLGGFDERYIGWGVEDEAMTVKLHRTTSQMASLQERVAVHLWHRRDHSQTYGNPHFEANRQRLHRLIDAQPAVFQSLCDVQRQLMGDPNKYTRKANTLYPSQGASADH